MHISTPRVTAAILHPRPLVSKALSLLIAVQLVLPAFLFSAAPAQAVTPDTTITVGSTPVGTFGSEMLGSNLTPWGAYWPSNQYDSLISDMGLGLMRVGHGEKWFVDMEKWYPAKGATPNWDATGELGAGHTFNQQIAWWKALNMPVLYTLNDELSSAMLNADGTLNYAEVARAWSLHVKHLIDSGVNLRYIEIGNEVDIQPMEGIELPPVAGSSKTATGRYIDSRVTPASNNQYIKLWNAVYPAIKAVAPNVKISAYPSGQGSATSSYFPYDYLFTTSPYKPDFFPFHAYSFAGPTPVQQVLDSTWGYTGTYVNDWDSTVHSVQDALKSWGVPDLEIAMTEFNYDGATQYTNADQMWDAVYYASVMGRASNAGVDFTTNWELFAGSNTDELITDVYENPTPQLKSQALAMRLMKQFRGATVLGSSVVSADNAVPYDWQGAPMTPLSVAGKRVESFATRDASGTYRLMLINKNASAAHSAQVSVAGAGSENATIKQYATRDALKNDTPTTSSSALSGGSLVVSLPALSITVVTIPTGSTPPPPPPPPPADTTPPTVAITTPSNGAEVSGSVAIDASASDDMSGIAKVEFAVDGMAIGVDAVAPYGATWDASAAEHGQPQHHREGHRRCRPYRRAPA